MAFTGNGEYLVSGDKEAVQMWRVADSQLIGTMKAKDVRAVAVSRDGRWIAAGKSWGETTVWDSQMAFEEVLTHNSDGHTVTSVDFSPTDSTRLVSASGNRKAYVWDVTARKKLASLEHPYWVVAAKFSPHGDHIATATFRVGQKEPEVRVYDARNLGNPPLRVVSKVTPYYNTGLLWLDNRNISILSNNAIHRIDLSTTPLTPSEWQTVDDSNYPCIVSPESGEFVLYSAGCDIAFFNIAASESTRQQCPTELPQDAQSIALSPDGRFLAVGGGDGKILVRSLVATHEKRAQTRGTRSSRTRV